MKKYLGFTIILFSIYACKKSATPGTEQPGSITSNSTIVAQTIKSDTDYYSNLYVYEDYRYDPQDRINLYLSYTVDSSVYPVRIDTIHTIHFLYENSDGSKNDSIKRPSFSVENYRVSLYRIANAAHMYLYDAQSRLVLDSLIDFYGANSSRGITLARKMHYNGTSIIVDNVNLDTYTSAKGIYRDTIIMDARGNAASTSTLNGKPYLADDLDNYKDAGFIKSTYTYNNLENPFYKMNISGVMAFIQTGFPGGDFYQSFLSKNYCSAILTHTPNVLNLRTTSFKYITNPLKGSRVEKMILSRQGINEHGGFEVINYK